MTNEQEELIEHILNGDYDYNQDEKLTRLETALADNLNECEKDYEIVRDELEAIQGHSLYQFLNWLGFLP